MGGGSVSLRSQRSVMGGVLVQKSASRRSLQIFLQETSNAVPVENPEDNPDQVSELLAPPARMTAKPTEADYDEMNHEQLSKNLQTDLEKGMSPEAAE